MSHSATCNVMEENVRGRSVAEGGRKGKISVRCVRVPVALRSQRDMHPLKKEVWIPINSGYGPDLGGPQKRNFSSGSPRT